MKYLLTTVEKYRVDTEAEASQTINEAKTNGGYALIKYNCEHKEKKDDDYYVVTLTKGFNDEKAPEYDVSVDYDVDAVGIEL